MSQAPLNIHDLEKVIAPFGQNRTLTADAYLSGEVFDWELESVFKSTWVCVGRGDEIVAPGQIRAVDVAITYDLQLTDDIAFDYDVSDNGVHVALQLSLNTGATTNDDVITLENIGDFLDGPNAALRMELAASNLVGIAILRYVVALEPLASATVETLVAEITPRIRGYLTPAKS